MKIGIDLGGSHIGVALIGLGGEIKDSKEKELEAKDKKKEIIQAYILEMVQTLLEENEIQKSSVSRIGLALPGIVKEKKAMQLWNLKIEALENTFLQEAYPRANIVMRNDADAAALAEKRYGALELYENALFLCLGTGIGGGYIYQGKLTFENAFEPGHMSIQKEGKRCNCGNIGCFETYASMKQFKQKVMNVLELDANTSSKELLAFLKTTKENPLVKHVIEEYIKNLSVGIGNLCNSLAIEAVCLGGSFVHFESLLLPALKKELKQGNYIFNNEKMPEIFIAKLGNSAGMLGAAL